MDYYYIVSSLPHLELGSAPPLTLEEFLRQCMGVLSEPEYLEVEALLKGRLDQCTSSSACALESAQTQLRNAVARIRGQRTGVDPRGQLREHPQFHGWIDKLATDAYTRENPRERELALDHARWHIADELAGIDQFTFGHVLAFALKLSIATRWHELDKQRGAERVEELIDGQTGESKSE